MAFDFKVSLSLSSSPTSHTLNQPRRLTMGKWADIVFAKIVEREGTEHYKIQKEVMDRERVIATAPELWQQLADEILEEANDLNSKRAGLVKIKDESHTGNLSISYGL